jgi:undecaprenyl-phosphate galactose phosphotransferase
MKKYITSLTLALLDTFFLVLLFYITSTLRTELNHFGVPLFNVLDIVDFSFVLFIVFLLLVYEKIYTIKYDFWQESLKVIKSFVVGYFIVLTFLALSKSNLEYSRLFISIYFLLGIILMPVYKRAIKKALYKLDFFISKTLLVGTDEEIDIFKKELTNNWYLGSEYSSQEYDNVIIISKGLSPEKLNSYISKYIQETRDLFVVPYITEINFAHSNIIEYSNIRYNTIQVENRLLNKKNILIKNIFDITTTLIILPFFMLIHLFIAIVIKIDSKGPLFFKQHRLGKDDEDFVCYKYRTMYVDSDEILREYLEKNPDEVTYYEIYHKYKNDPRITKIGALLRSTSLDELAQLINVLKGEMSLVGPRPYMLKEACKLGENQEFILKVKPGITGLWQVSGRNELTFQERNNLEVWYIKNWSLWADFVILIKTVKVVLKKVGAK